MHPKFQALRTLLARIPHINSGGCAVAALAMYKVGVELNMPVQIMFLYSYEEELEYELNCAAMEGSPITVYCTHAVCVVNNEAYDSKCKIPTDLYPYKHFVTEDFAIRATSDKNMWNPKFDRKTWVPRIEMFLGYKLPI